MTKRASTGNYSLCENATVKKKSTAEDRPCLSFAVRICAHCGAKICDEHALKNPPKMGTSFSCLACYAGSS